MVATTAPDNGGDHGAVVIHRDRRALVAVADLASARRGDVGINSLTTSAAVIAAVVAYRKQNCTKWITRKASDTFINHDTPSLSSLSIPSCPQSP